MHTFGRRRVTRAHIAHQRYHPYSSRRRGPYIDEDDFIDHMDDDFHSDKYEPFEEEETDDDGMRRLFFVFVSRQPCSFLPREWHCTRQISREVSDRIVIAVLSNQDLLLSSTLAKTAQNNRRKARKWLEIVEGLASVYPDQPLSIKTVKKNFDYSKRRVRAARRRYEFALNHSGDGPQPVDPTLSFSVAERMLDMYLRSSTIPPVTSVAPRSLKVEETTPPVDDETPDGPSTSRADDIPLQAASILDQHLAAEEADDTNRKRRLYDKLEAFLDAAIPLLHGISQHFGFSTSQSSQQHTHDNCVPSTNGNVV
uniref:MADF domain-containing protein n=1 Tax=Ascaris lumbricoides TaxID=6252 RepID=A0A0M3HWU0_ASCLU